DRPRDAQQREDRGGGERGGHRGAPARRAGPRLPAGPVPHGAPRVRDAGPLPPSGFVAPPLWRGLAHDAPSPFSPNATVSNTCSASASRSAGVPGPAASTSCTATSPPGERNTAALPEAVSPRIGPVRPSAP